LTQRSHIIHSVFHKRSRKGKLLPVKQKNPVGIVYGFWGKIMSKIMTLTEVAEYLRVHSTTVYRLLKQGKLPAFKVGSDWRFDAQAIDRWLRGQESDRGIEEN
jgi:excisionase family DNA binding protein